jgi:hypothetical protein
MTLSVPYMMVDIKSRSSGLKAVVSITYTIFCKGILVQALPNFKDK